MKAGTDIEPQVRKNFSGLRVGAFESRLQSEMQKLIENLGGVAFVAPSMLSLIHI